MATSTTNPAPEVGARTDPNGNRDQAAYFLSLTVENVRCFGPKQTLDLSDGHGKPAPWTIILGLNGTGKTTLLQLLVGFELIPLAGSQPEPKLPRMIGRAIPNPPFLQRAGKGWQGLFVSADIAMSGMLSAQPFRVARPYCKFQSMGLVFSPVQSENDPGPVTLPYAIAYGAGRRVGGVTLGSAEFDDPTATLFSDRAELRNPEEWLLRLDYAATKPSDVRDQQKARLEQVKKLLLSILPEGEVEDIRLLASEGTNPVPRAEFKTPYGWVPLRQLGYGYQTLITWVADFANRMVERYPDSTDPLAEPAVCLVDEIDLHLHPVWQRKLMGFLTARFPNTQFIATAHSPLVVQAAADANLAVLRREGDHVVIDNDVDTIRNWRVDQILTSDLFGLETARPPHIERLLTERTALLAKSKLTQADQRRLKVVESEIGNLPSGETVAEVRERDEIRRTLDLLMKERQPSP